MRTIIDEYIKTWEDRCYPDGIPDQLPSEIKDKAPSYKNICMAILKNDISIIGIERPKSEYYNQLKHIELKAAGKILSKQLTIL